MRGRRRPTGRLSAVETSCLVRQFRFNGKCLLGQLGRGSVVRIASLMAFLYASIAVLVVPAVEAASSTYTYSGIERTFKVPAGVTSIHVVAVGGQGATGGDYNSPPGGAGGFGAGVTADVPVTPGTTIYVEVGGNGTTRHGYGGPPHARGGFNGGGDGGSYYAGVSGGGRGGGSDIRTLPSSSSSTLSSRLLVAAGGGGGGARLFDHAAPGAGGSAAQAGLPGTAVNMGRVSRLAHPPGSVLADRVEVLGRPQAVAPVQPTGNMEPAMVPSARAGSAVPMQAMRPSVAAVAAVTTVAAAVPAES